MTLFAGEYSSVLQIPVRALAYQQVLSLHKAQPNKYKPVVSSGLWSEKLRPNSGVCCS